MAPSRRVAFALFAAALALAAAAVVSAEIPLCPPGTAHLTGATECTNVADFVASQSNNHGLGGAAATRTHSGATIDPPVVTAYSALLTGESAAGSEVTASLDLDDDVTFTVIEGGDELLGSQSGPDGRLSLFFSGVDEVLALAGNAPNALQAALTATTKGVSGGLLSMIGDLFTGAIATDLENTLVASTATEYEASATVYSFLIGSHADASADGFSAGSRIGDSSVSGGSDGTTSSVVIDEEFSGSASAQMASVSHGSTVLGSVSYTGDATAHAANNGAVVHATVDAGAGSVTVHLDLAALSLGEWTGVATAFDSNDTSDESNYLDASVYVSTWVRNQRTADGPVPLVYISASWNGGYMYAEAAVGRHANIELNAESVYATLRSANQVVYQNSVHSGVTKEATAKRSNQFVTMVKSDGDTFVEGTTTPARSYLHIDSSYGSTEALARPGQMKAYATFTLSSGAHGDATAVFGESAKSTALYAANETQLEGLSSAGDVSSLYNVHGTHLEAVIVPHNGATSLLVNVNGGASGETWAKATETGAEGALSADYGSVQLAYASMSTHSVVVELDHSSVIGYAQPTGSAKRSVAAASPAVQRANTVAKAAEARKSESSTTAIAGGAGMAGVVVGAAVAGFALRSKRREASTEEAMLTEVVEE